MTLGTIFIENLKSFFKKLKLGYTLCQPIIENITKSQLQDENSAKQLLLNKVI